ncbi:MAG: formylglycine-generating enzyme family protein [Nitrospinota bacterium]
MRNWTRRYRKDGTGCRLKAQRSSAARRPIRETSVFAVLVLALLPSLTLFGSAVNAADPPPVLIGKDGVRLLLIPAGKFRKGSTQAEIKAAAKLARRYHPYVRPEWFADETPPQKVLLPAFYMDETEVSIATYLWKGNPPPDSSKRFELSPWTVRDGSVKGDASSWQIPVSNVSWKEAVSYCRRVGRRLPTSDEWEKAARGADGRIFPWGNRFDPARMNSYEAGLRRAVPVGGYPSGASPYGVLDMAGNVWEWVADWYDPPSRKEDRRKVIRGGGWGYGGAFARAANLGSVWPRERHPSLGFRCAKDP